MPVYVTLHVPCTHRHGCAKHTLFVVFIFFLYRMMKYVYILFPEFFFSNLIRLKAWLVDYNDGGLGFLKGGGVNSANLLIGSIGAL